MNVTVEMKMKAMQVMRRRAEEMRVAVQDWGWIKNYSRLFC